MVVISKSTQKDISFIAGHEGKVLKAYRCPAGVITIGYGFTMGSRVFAEWWRAKHGRDLRMGDTITLSEANMLLGRLIDQEYGAAVAREVKPKKQNHFGGASSTSYNCGTGALKWKWAQALARGDIAECARLLRNTATTANGRKLAGLVRRRKEEAHLIETGDYGDLILETPSVSNWSEAIAEYQAQLKTLGYYDGEVDGISGPKTKSAVLEFQEDSDLTVDGIVGPATRAALIRALDLQKQKEATTGGTVGGGAVGGGEEIVTNPDPAIATDVILNMLMWGLGIGIVIFVAFMIFRYRGRITGKRVPT